jgi:hemolysin activation/secretion protein
MAWPCESAEAAKSPPRLAQASDDASSATAPPQRLDINQFQIDGVELLGQEEVEEAVYPFMGPDRTAEDVEKARAALEAAYNAKGYQAVAVEIPQQQVTDGVVTLKVTETKIGRLRVRGSRYFSLDAIKEEAPSVAEGKVPNFNDIGRDIVALNQLPDRRVTPALRAGAKPGTVDVDLNVEDSFPLHGSIELNNRYSADTTRLRLNASLRYDNLWQLGHSLSLSYQVAPENPDDAKVFSASYLARLRGVPWLSLLASGTHNDSNVSTLGGTNVTGRGDVIGGRAIFTLPGDEDFYHTFAAGIDYKDFLENVALGGSQTQTPITYYPISTAYAATWQGKGSSTQLDAGVIFGLRGLGSNPGAFDNKRFSAGGGFIYLRGDLSRSQDLPGDLQLWGKLQGQLADQPLVSNEQLSAGGLDTVRGYLESEVLGDNGLLLSVELRSPSLSDWFEKGSALDEWRFYFFADGGTLSLNQPLPQQKSIFDLASIGLGSRIRLLQHVNGSLDLGVPLIGQVTTHAYSPRLTFRTWSDF